MQGRCAAAQAVQPARAPERSRADRRRALRRAVPGGERASRGAAHPLRAGSSAPARGGTRSAGAHPARLPGDGDCARRARSSRGTLGTGAHSLARAALRDRARELDRPGAPRRREHRIRVPAPRRREDRDPGQDPPEEGHSRGGGAAAARDAHGARRATAERRRSASGAGVQIVRHHHERWDGERVSRRAQDDRDPAGGTRVRRCGRARCDHERPSVSPRAELGGGGGRDRSARRVASSTRRSSRPSRSAATGSAESTTSSPPSSPIWTCPASDPSRVRQRTWLESWNVALLRARTCPR